MKKKLIAAGLIACGLAACAAPSRFEWGNYENGLYQYYRDPENRANYERSLVRAIERGDATDRTAPGLNAELGFLYLEQGETVLAEQHFRREIELFPESRSFLERFLGVEQAGTSTSDTVDQRASDEVTS